METNYAALADRNRKSNYLVVASIAIVVVIAAFAGGFYINAYVKQREQSIEKQAKVDQSKIQIERGIVFVREKEYTQAISAYEQASALDPEAKIPLGDLAYLYYKTGNFPAAEQKSLEYISKYADDEYLWVIYGNLGNIYLSLKQYENAVQYFEKALQLSPPTEFSRYKIYNDLGVTYDAMERHKDAIVAYKQAIVLIESQEINSEELRIALANMYENLGNAYLENQSNNQIVGKDARAAYDRAVSLRRQY